MSTSGIPNEESPVPRGRTAGKAASPHVPRTFGTHAFGGLLLPRFPPLLVQKLPPGLPIGVARDLSLDKLTPLSTAGAGFEGSMLMPVCAHIGERGEGLEELAV